jgi:hypothetical protein
MLDYDYIKDLPEDAQKWLGQFSDEYYLADFRYEKPLHKTKKLKRDRYSFQNSSYRDTYNIKALSGELVRDWEDNRTAEDTDERPTDRYLNLPDYKDAVAEMRTLVDVPQKKRSKEQWDRLKLLQDYLLSMHEAEQK